MRLVIDLQRDDARDIQAGVSTFGCIAPSLLMFLRPNADWQLQATRSRNVEGRNSE